MRALVVYESMYGNTAAIGEAVAAALRARGLSAEAALVTHVDPAQTAGVDLLVVGGPTHVHGMTTERSRKAAADDEDNTFPEPTVEPGLRGWLKELPPGEGRAAACFDTRIDKPRVLTGSAAKGIGRRLRGHGFQLMCEPESFLVSTENRLIDGEAERAAAWGGEVADMAFAGAPSG
jgi:hypothetical protein